VLATGYPRGRKEATILKNKAIGTDLLTSLNNGTTAAALGQRSKTSSKLDIAPCG
jgi:hypothetical protein